MSSLALGVWANKNLKELGNRRLEIKEPEDLETLMICAIRYCQGRQTYMPGLVIEIVSSQLQTLSARALSVMISDCQYQENCDLFGDEKIDKPSWIEFRQKLKDEWLRRGLEWKTEWKF